MCFGHISGECRLEESVMEEISLRVGDDGVCGCFRMVLLAMTVLES